jgi:hypothetical protein
LHDLSDSEDNDEPAAALQPVAAKDKDAILLARADLKRKTGDFQVYKYYFSSFPLIYFIIVVLISAVCAVLFKMPGKPELLTAQHNGANS